MKHQLNEISFTTHKGEAFEVPIEGSLGLLAYGYIGLMAWRQKCREFAIKQSNSCISNENKTDITVPET